MPPFLPSYNRDTVSSFPRILQQNKERSYQIFNMVLQVRRKNVGKQNQIILDENVDKQSQNMY